MTEWEYAGSTRWLETPPCPECKTVDDVKLLTLPTRQSYGRYDCKTCEITFAAAPKDWVKAAF